MAETLIPWDPVKYLDTEEDIRLYFCAALEEDYGDGKLVKKVLGNIARALSEKHIKHEFGMSGRGNNPNAVRRPQPFLRNVVTYCRGARNEADDQKSGPSPGGDLLQDG